MVVHILGWLTVAAQVGIACGLIRYLWVTGSRPWTWLRPLPIPKPTAGDFTLSSGSDYMGAV